MDLEEARRRIAERADLHAFISISDERGNGTVVGVKDLVDVEGMVTTAGGIILPNTPAPADAPVIARMRSAGCVVVGKTNLHEFAYGVTSINPHYGAVRNPHDPQRVAGGSSGGSAVSVAAAMCDWAVGSDTGGSIRIPAALCGVAGFKPALGSIDTAGVVPLSWSLDTLGPLARDMTGVARAYAMMSGEPTVAPSDREPNLAVPAGWVSGLDSETSAAWDLVSAGIPEVEFVERAPLYQVGLTVLLVEAAAFHRRWATESPDRYGVDVLAHIRRGLGLLGVDYVEALRTRRLLQEAAQRAMEKIDALVLPSTAIVAPKIDGDGDVREPLSRFTRPFNTTGQPVAVLPAPTKGLPVGVQVVGKSNAATIQAAMWLERRWQTLEA